MIKCKLFSAIVIFLLSGCASYYPQVVDIPLIKEKGDIRLNAGAFMAPNFEDAANLGGHVTYSHGVTNVLAVQGYGSLDFMLRIHLQGALGLYKGFENNSVIEMYGGYGFGTGGMWNVQMDFYQLAFAQFNLGKYNQGKANIDYGLGLKGGYMYNDYSNYNNILNLPNIEKKYSWLIEPSVFFRIGGSRIKYNMTVNYFWASTIPEIYYFPISVGMGVNFKFGNKKKNYY